MKQQNTASDGNTLWLAYILALSLIACVATLGALKVQKEFNDQENSSKVINLAGQQRMLSQKMSKNALLIQHSSSMAERQKALVELEQTLLLFSASHKRLLGVSEAKTRQNPAQPFSLFNNPAIMAKFEQIQPYYLSLSQSSQLILNSQELRHSLSIPKEISLAIEALLNNESMFLSHMNDIVSEYEQHVTKRLNHVQSTSQIIFFSILVALILTAVFIFRPASQKISLLLKALFDKQQLLSENNQQLNDALEHLHEIQLILIETEKQVVFSGMAASFTHDVNTPLGICITSTSLLQDDTENITQAYQSENISKKMLTAFLNQQSEGLSIVKGNLDNAIALTKSFNKIAVEQCNEEQRLINLSDELNQVLMALQPKIRKTAHRVNLECPEDLVFNSYPSAFYRIFTNLIINSLIHGFEDKEAGHININIQQDNNELVVVYSDDGKGVSDNLRERIFDAYFTTKKAKGGSGLGTYIVYNQVTEVLNGEISCTKVDTGIQFKMVIPLTT